MQFALEICSKGVVAGLVQLLLLVLLFLKVDPGVQRQRAVQHILEIEPGPLRVAGCSKAIEMAAKRKVESVLLTSAY